MALNYEACVEYLYKIPRFTKKAPLSQTEDFLGRLGVDLSMRTPKIIHVAGTNGKGSVCAYLDAVLRAEGYHTGLFTSPHLVRPEERIRIDGKMLSEETFVRCFAQVYPAAKAMERDGAGHPAFFSFMLGMAMTAFAGETGGSENRTPLSEKQFARNPSEIREKPYPDYIILETGMGGRLDNTNVFRHPVVTVITRIGLDHTQYLGETREAIAGEKAGILKPGVPVVYLEDPVSAPVIEKRAEELGCPCRKVDAAELKILEKGREGILFSVGKKQEEILPSVKSFPGNFSSNPVPASGCARGERGLRENTGAGIVQTEGRGADGEYRIPFAADYQTENAALAIRAAGELGCSETAIREGLGHARWPGRMQKVADGFYVDGAHNVDGVRALLRGLDDLAGSRSGRRILLFGAVQDKDYEEMYRELAEGYRPDLVILTGLHTPRGVPVEKLTQLAYAGGESPDFAGKTAGDGDPAVGERGQYSREKSKGLIIKKQVAAFPAVREALKFACGEKNPEDFLLCAGSLYLVGEVLGILQ
ncbi:MAG: bifunctional folylpolyglutamate synthase/dihydrofolate synthase [Lachnospiraceae bacterium]|nr:bifunctional folylpolyglutamate synthase/dihydrofolate synthase [Lachnospiraceae bacterium]